MFHGFNSDIPDLTSTSCTKSCAMPLSLWATCAVPVPRRLVFQSRNVQSHLSLLFSLPKNRKTSQEEKKMEESCREKWHAKESCLKKLAVMGKSLQADVLLVYLDC